MCATSLRLACIPLPCSALYQLLEPHVTNLLAESKLGTWTGQHQSSVRRPVGQCGQEELQHETLALFCPLLGPCWPTGSGEVWDKIIMIKQEQSKSGLSQNRNPKLWYNQVWQEQQEQQLKKFQFQLTLLQFLVSPVSCQLSHFLDAEASLKPTPVHISPTSRIWAPLTLFHISTVSLSLDCYRASVDQKMSDILWKLYDQQLSNCNFPKVYF